VLVAGVCRAANPGVEYEIDQKVEARLGHDEPFTRAKILSRRLANPQAIVDGSAAAGTPLGDAGESFQQS
jgi:hypothetical protein